MSERDDFARDRLQRRNGIYIVDDMHIRCRCTSNYSIVAMFARALSLATLAAVAFAAPPSYKPKPGFVKTDGTKFSLDGKEFFYAGSNAYYLPFANVCLLRP